MPNPQPWGVHYFLGKWGHRNLAGPVDAHFPISPNVFRPEPTTCQQQRLDVDMDNYRMRDTTFLRLTIHPELGFSMRRLPIRCAEHFLHAVVGSSAARTSLQTRKPVCDKGCSTRIHFPVTPGC